MEDHLNELERKGHIKRGTGTLPDWFWTLPRPKDPEASVRRALYEDRGDPESRWLAPTHHQKIDGEETRGE